MKIENIDVKDTIENAKRIFKKDKNISTESREILESLITITTALVDRFSTNSSNSGKPPSSDPNRKKKKRTKKSKNTRGGQNGHVGLTLNPVPNPDEIKNISIDKRKLPRDKSYTSNGYISRQVVRNGHEITSRFYFRLVLMRL